MRRSKFRKPGSTMPKPRYSMAEFARRGQEFYERAVLPQITVSDQGKFVAIDIETGAFEIDTDDFAATERLQADHPDSQMWLIRIGQWAGHRFGSRPVYSRI
ncbi:MAG: hypothetical protein AB7N70_39870 [Dehalococcoidia bacterium]